MTFEKAWQQSIGLSTPDEQEFVDEISKHKPIIEAFFRLGISEGKNQAIKEIDKIRLGKKHDCH